MKKYETMFVLDANLDEATRVETVELLKPLFKQHKATIKLLIKEEIYIYGDYNKLKQVFINLLKNTIEAKKEQVPLEVLLNLKQKHQKGAFLFLLYLFNILIPLFPFLRRNLRFFLFHHNHGLNNIVPKNFYRPYICCASSYNNYRTLY